MTTILIAGAGKSSTYLISYMLTHSVRYKWKIIVADSNEEAIREKTGYHPNAIEAVFDILNDEERGALVAKADFVISLMPPHLHILLAKDCLKHKKDLITSSYISDEMREMDAAVKEAGLMFMCEMGLDPGIDHMTASSIIDGIKKITGRVLSFKSYCGGLIAPESDTNPWHYKISWNPRNIVTAGKDGAHYLLNGKDVEIGYHELFENNRKINVDGVGQLAYYPNRDSTHYKEVYDIPEASTFIRATLRHPDFMKGWQTIVELGLTDTDDSFDTTGYTYESWVKRKSVYNGSTIPLPQHISQTLKIVSEQKVLKMMEWLGLFDDRPLPFKTATSADLLQDLLQRKWAMSATDKDLVVMQHDVEYEHRGNKYQLTSTMIVKGEDRNYSAMAKTVGLPIGILARMVVNNKILTKPTGVLIPTMKNIYRPVMTELKHHGVEFNDNLVG